MTEETTDFKRSLGLLDATAIVAGSMIGSGIFIVSADMANRVVVAYWIYNLIGSLELWRASWDDAKGRRSICIY